MAALRPGGTGGSAEGRNAMAGNYDKMQEQARQLFQSYDPEKLRARLSLPEDPGGIPIRFLGEAYLVRASDGEVVDGRGEKAPFETAMSIYDILCRSEKTPVLSGAWVPTMELHHIMGSNSVHEDLGQESARFFSGRTEALAEACRALGGTPGSRGDLSFRIPVFDFFPVELRFWEADEEFPAQMQFFWDANALDFAHYETLWYMTGALKQRLLRMMDK